jgi:hypothetical protein
MRAHKERLMDNEPVDWADQERRTLSCWDCRKGNRELVGDDFCDFQEDPSCAQTCLSYEPMTKKEKNEGVRAANGIVLQSCNPSDINEEEGLAEVDGLVDRPALEDLCKEFPVVKGVLEETALADATGAPSNMMDRLREKVSELLAALLKRCKDTMSDASHKEIAEHADRLLAELEAVMSDDCSARVQTEWKKLQEEKANLEQAKRRFNEDVGKMEKARSILQMNLEVVSAYIKTYGELEKNIKATVDKIRSGEGIPNDCQEPADHVIGGDLP